MYHYRDFNTFYKEIGVKFSFKRINKLVGECTTHISKVIYKTLFSQAAKNAEEKAKRALVDAARLADELRAEQVKC